MNSNHEKARIENNPNELEENIRKQNEIKEKQLLINQKSQEYELEKRKLELERLQNLDKYKHDLEIRKLDALKREKEQFQEREKIKMDNDNKIMQKTKNINYSNISSSNQDNMFDMVYKEMIEKGIEFLKDHLEGYDIVGSDIERSIETFKLAMQYE